MKFIHMADMHLDAPFTTLNTKGDLGKIRRQDQREIFQKIIEYIKTNKIPYLFIAGDFYEHEFIRKSTIEYVNELFKTIPETKIYITPGNHDPYIKNSMYETFHWNENVKIFHSQIEKVEEPEIDIYGVGFSSFTCESLGIENIQIENKNKINILITHGDLNASNKTEMPYNPIAKNSLKEKGFDYIALGHIHKPNYKEEENQNIVYPGSTIAMGFDELGNHGFIEGTLEKGKIQLNFVPIDNKEFKEQEIEIKETEETQKYIYKQDYTKIKIKAVDKETKKELEGIEIKIINEKEEEETKEALNENKTQSREIKRLGVGTYEIETTKEPYGYKKTKRTNRNK